MLANIMKWVSISALFLAAVFWRFAGNYQLLLDLIVCMAAVVMVQQAVRLQEYAWAAALTGTALLLNPVVPLFTPAGNLIFFLFLLALSPFVIGFAALIDATITLYPNVITEPYFQDELRVPETEWAAL